MEFNKLKGVIPEQIFNELTTITTKFNCNTPLRLAHLLAQCAHESSNFTRFKENLNYSEKRLVEVFKNRFDINKDKVLSESELKKVKDITGNPIKIGNFIYANMGGNGNEASGDGYKYSGKGAIQLTLKSNYAAFAKFIGEDVLTHPELVETKYALSSAVFFFEHNNLWKICDEGSTNDVVEKVTKHVNGGVLGLKERIEYFVKYYKLLK